MGRYKDLTYRAAPCWKGYGVDVAIHLFKKPVVVYMPTRPHPWRKGKLTNVLPAQDRFRVTWSNGRYSNLRGLWRIHDAKLFTKGRLPVPTGPAKLHSTHQTNPKEGVVMAAKVAKKKGTAKSRNSGNFNMREASAAEKKRMAQQVKTLRKAGEPWDGDGGICEQLGLSSALQGRTLLREFGGEELIREQERNGSSKKKPAAKKAAAKKPAAKKPAVKRKVSIKRGRGKAANPS